MNLFITILFLLLCQFSFAQLSFIQFNINSINFKFEDKIVNTRQVQSSLVPNHLVNRHYTRKGSYILNNYSLNADLLLGFKRKDYFQIFGFGFASINNNGNSTEKARSWDLNSKETDSNKLVSFEKLNKNGYFMNMGLSKCWEIEDVNLYVMALQSIGGYTSYNEKYSYINIVIKPNKPDLISQRIYNKHW